MESNGSGWLADSLHAVDNNIKEVLKMIEDKNIQISSDEPGTEDQKLSDMVTYMDDLRTKYHLLAERYSQLAKERGEDFHDLDESLAMATPFYTPVSKFTEHKPELTTVGSDIRLSDIPCKNDFGSSSTSLSDSASENSNSELLTDGGLDGEERVVQIGKEKILIKQIEEYELELQIANANVRSSMEEVAKFKSKLEENEVVVKQLKDEIEVFRSLVERKDEVIVSEKSKVSELEKIMLSDADEISEFNEEVQRLKGALSDALNAIIHKDELHLSEVASLQEQKNSVENSYNEQTQQIKSLENEISALQIEISRAISSYDAEEASWKTEKKSLEAENMAKSNTVESLSKCADALKHKNDMANAKLETLNAELSHKDNVIHQLNERINHLNSVNADLNVTIRNLRGDQDAIRQLEVRASETQRALSQAISESDSLRKCIDESRVKVKELEQELEEQRALVAEGAELKREAIRQLCISLEHYRIQYLELREVVVGKKRRTSTHVGSRAGTPSS